MTHSQREARLISLREVQVIKTENSSKGKENKTQKLRTVYLLRKESRAELFQHRIVKEA